MPEWVQSLRERAVQELRAATEFTRDDYREIAELSLIVLQDQPARGIHIIRPGACHHARWMGRVSVVMWHAPLLFDRVLLLCSPPNYL